ncbi:MAG TPA: isoaspartyl peptidase/L-asparaginase [Candidatus Limnocylindria bacterium]|nr:isoaspartyl peptidase/L-asparaginase [Candidatus Limnocylindria bacterium]
MKMTQRCLPAVVAMVVALAVANYSRPAHGARGGGATPAGPEFVLVAHGGAGTYKNMTPELLEARRTNMVRAIQKGYEILTGGGTSLDAVEATIRVMEDSGLFDAGRGAYYTRDGIPELDAAIMDGRTLAAGSVASVKHVASPIHLARLVMEKTPHVLLVSGGAEEFARSQGIELVSPYYFYNEREWRRYEKAKAAAAEKKTSAAAREDEHGTVGVVALDRGGNLAAGTSTGGTTMKMPGRVGDSPIIGAGTYANNESCAVSGTGVGEYFMRNIVAADICQRVRYLHIPLEQAANDVVMKELAEQHGEAGVIALTRAGGVATPFNTEGMMTGTVRADGNIVMKGWNKTAEPMVFPAVH